MARVGISVGCYQYGYVISLISVTYEYLRMTQQYPDSESRLGSLGARDLGRIMLLTLCLPMRYIGFADMGRYRNVDPVQALNNFCFMRTIRKKHLIW